MSNQEPDAFVVYGACLAARDCQSCALTPVEHLNKVLATFDCLIIPFGVGRYILGAKLSFVRLGSGTAMPIHPELDAQARLAGDSIRLAAGYIAVHLDEPMCWFVGFTKGSDDGSQGLG